MLSFELAFISPGGGELVLIMLVLILLFGAQDAPHIFRTIHTLLDKLQRAAADFRYKIMYGDLHPNPPDEKTYDVEVDYPDDECSKSGVPSSELEEENSKPGTENPELKS